MKGRLVYLKRLRLERDGSTGSGGKDVVCVCRAGWFDMKPAPACPRLLYSAHPSPHRLSGGNAVATQTPVSAPTTPIPLATGPTYHTWHMPTIAAAQPTKDAISAASTTGTPAASSQAPVEADSAAEKQMHSQHGGHKDHEPVPYQREEVVEDIEEVIPSRDRADKVHEHDDAYPDVAWDGIAIAAMNLAPERRGVTGDVIRNNASRMSLLRQHTCNSASLEAGEALDSGVPLGQLPRGRNGRELVLLKASIAEDDVDGLGPFLEVKWNVL